MNKVCYSNLGSNCGDRNMYIRSTDLEHKNWESLLMSFPDEALYYMCKGNKIVIIDRCSKKKGKVQRIFCPVFQDFLRVIRCEKPKFKYLQHHLKLALQAYRSSKSIHRKYEFFKHKLQTVRVVGRTIQMRREPTVWAL